MQNHSTHSSGIASDELPPNDDLDGLPPHTAKGEAGILGCVILSPAEGLTMLRRRRVSPDWFYLLPHRTTFETMLDMDKSGTPIDSILLAERLRTDGQYHAVGGSEFLDGLINCTPAASLITHYVELVEDAYIRRQCFQTMREFREGLHTSRDIQNTLRHALRSMEFLTQLKADDGLSVRTPNEILAMQFDPADRIWGDWMLAKGQQMTLLGEGGLGKSRLLQQFIVCQIIGRPFLGIEMNGGPQKWLVLQTENSCKRLHDDLKALRYWVGESDWPLVDQYLHIHTIEKDDDADLSLANPRTCARICEKIRAIQPGIVAVDPLGYLGIGNLDNDTDMRLTLGTLSQIVRKGNPARAIVALHHSLTGRAGAQRATGFDKASFGRNSKALHAWTRAQINVAPGNPEKSSLVIACGKNNNGQEFAPFGVALDPRLMIYKVDTSFDIAAWENEVRQGKGAQGPILTPDMVVGYLERPLNKKTLVKACMDDTGCGKSLAYRRVEQAERLKLIQLHKLTQEYARAA